MAGAVRIRVRIRGADPSDAARLAALCTELGYSSQVASISERLRRLGDDHVVRVAIGDGDAVIGFAHTCLTRGIVSAGMAEVLAMVVSERHRGDGVGGALLRDAERWAHDNGADQMRVRSNVVRERAHAFYRSTGYSQTKTSLVFEKAL